VTYLENTLKSLLNSARLSMHLGTLIYTWLKGIIVGTDEFGNKYYRAKKATLHGREKRWVLYKGLVDGSKVPPHWHAWLHHVTDQPLTAEALNNFEWQKPHLANQTGTADAYRPKGHAYLGGERDPAIGDYEAWSPK
jgi:NADH:ubiquinone oxidoreductase subunit